MVTVAHALASHQQSQDTHEVLKEGTSTPYVQEGWLA
jgi:hypothetical protein